VITTGSAIGGILGFSVLMFLIGYSCGRYREFQVSEEKMGRMRRAFNREHDKLTSEVKSLWRENCALSEALERQMMD
jgi:hypothetical protein